MTISLTIIILLSFLGTWCLFFAVVLFLRSRGRHRPDRSVTNGDGLEVSVEDSTRFIQAMSVDAPQLLQHLALFRREKGPAYLAKLIEDYERHSDMEVRKKALRVFSGLFVPEEPDEKHLNDAVSRLTAITASELDDSHELLSQVRQTSLLQVRLLLLLDELFTIAGSKITKVKDRLRGLEIEKVSPESRESEPQMAETISLLHELIGNLSETLPRKETKDKAARRGAMARTLDRIQQLLDDHSHLTDWDTVERILALKVIERYWHKTSDFYMRVGGERRDPRGLPTAEALSRGAFFTSRSSFGMKRAQVAFLSFAVLFYALSFVSWRLLSRDVFDVARALKNVVKIESASGTGTGFILRENHLIITNYHVVGNERTVDAYLKGMGRSRNTTRRMGVIVIASDEVEDVAVLRIVDAYTESEIPLGFKMRRSNAFEIGQVVHVIGNPLGLEDVYTRGNVMKVQGNTAFMDVKVGPGNSGGPVCDEYGRVIGITTAYAKPDGGDFDFGIATSTTRAWELIRSAMDSE